MGQPLLPPGNGSGLRTGNGGDQGWDPEGQNGPPYSTFPQTPPENSDTSAKSTSSRARVNPRIISDSILGLSDGLTVPFALSASLSSFSQTKVVVLGSLAELVAGAISMGLGGFVGAKSERESYETLRRETQQLIDSSPSETMALVRGVFAPYGLPDEPVSEMNASLHDSPERLLEFLITFHHKQAKPDSSRTYTSPATLALGYFIGGFIPLIPYFIAKKLVIALEYSIGVMAITLFAFGYIKTCVVRGWRGRLNFVAGVNGAIQMVLIGGIAAGAAVALVRSINHGD